MITETIITAVTTQAIKSLVEKVIAPRFEKFIKSAKTDYKEYIDRNNHYFEEYYNRTYEKYSIINTLVFHNSQRKLKDVYVAQTLVKDNRFESEEETTIIDGVPRELIKKYKKILIEDTAGMGKSTITKRMFIDLIDNGIEGVGVPIYIELNRLNKNHTIIQEIQEGVSSLSKEFDNDLLLRFIQTGGFIFFLDGYDEISIADRREVTRDIQSFILKAGTDNYYILTSRPESSLPSFGDFQSFKIKPLTKREAFKLLINYDCGQKKEVSAKLIELLKSGEYDSINEYLKNPLLVSLLYAAFDHKQTIPLKKHLFYRQVYEAFFDSHDLSKGIDAHQKRSGLDIDDFNRVLKYIGYECLIRIGVQFDKDTILNAIDSAKAFSADLDFASNDFLKDLMTSVPLFSKDGTGYKWAHKSLMEYFAARFIADDAKENQDKILKAMSESMSLDKYLNTLDIYYDIDLKGFSKNITLPFCELFMKFYDDHFIASNTSKDLIDERISALFIYNGSFWVSLNDSKAIDSGQIIPESHYDPLIDRFDIQHSNNRIVNYQSDFTNIHDYYIAELLSRKNNSIFKRSRGGFDTYYSLRRDSLPKEFNEFEPNKIYVIDLRTGDQSDILYDFINQMLIQYVSREELIDYESCKKEAERIREEIDRSNNASILLAGI